MWARAILHVDMDAFYASVEQRDRPELLGQAVIVGGGGRRGVVSSPSYEARRFGVKSAMPMHVALRLCPHAKTVVPRIDRYAEVSRHLMAIFGRFTPLVEPLSLDEAFLDISGTEALFGSPVDVAWKVQRAVKDELRLSCAVGCAATKYVAKVASDLKKPGGIVVVTPGEERQFLEPLSIERLWGVGPKTAERLHSLGLFTIGDVYRFGEQRLADKLGHLGEHLFALSSGADARPVDTERERKSIGAERTLEYDVRGVGAVQKELIPLADEVAASLRAHKLRALGVRLKIKYADFHRASRELRLPHALEDAGSILAALEQLVTRLDLERPIRLVGLSVTELEAAEAPRQASLFDDPGTARQERLGHTVDKIRDRFGAAAVGRASTLPSGTSRLEQRRALSRRERKND